MSDGHIQVPADGVGKKVDATEVTRFDAVVVERQRMEARDADDEILNTSEIVSAIKETNNLLFQILLNLTEGNSNG